MKDLSFTFFKSLMGAKMGKGFQNFCNNDSSISTLNQHNNIYQPDPTASARSQVPSSSSIIETDSVVPNVPPRQSVTLEEMILQLELEEEKARREKAARASCKCKEEEEGAEYIRSKFLQRMSCVNNSDILRSARSALSQYPRFSLDGHNAMYRSSFQNNANVGRPIEGLKLGRILHLPKSLGGESVVWRKPGLVPKLMGLEAMPLPISRLNHNDNSNNRRHREDFCTAFRNHNLRRSTQRSEIERRLKRHVLDSSICWRDIKRSGRSGGGGVVVLAHQRGIML